MKIVNTDTIDIVALRREPLSRKLTQALVNLAPSSLQIEIVGIRDLPLYNQDDEGATPAAWQTFRARRQCCSQRPSTTDPYPASLKILSTSGRALTARACRPASLRA